MRRRNKGVHSHLALAQGPRGRRFHHLFEGPLDFAETEGLRRDQLPLSVEGGSPTTLNAVVSALWFFFFKATLGSFALGECAARQGARRTSALDPTSPCGGRKP